MGVVGGGGGFNNVSGAAQLDGRRDGGDAAIPHSTRDSVPSDFDLLPGNQTTHIRFVHEDPHPNVGKIGLLQEQVSRLNVSALFYGQGIDNAVERRANVGFQESG